MHQQCAGDGLASHAGNDLVALRRPRFKLYRMTGTKGREYLVILKGMAGGEVAEQVAIPGGCERSAK